MLINDAKEDPTLEASQMETAVNAGVDGILLFYIDPTSSVPAIDRAIADGVPVVPIFPAPESKAPVTVSDSEFDRGAFVAKQVLKDFEGKKLSVVIANIPVQFGLLDLRVAGFESVLVPAAQKSADIEYLKDSNILESNGEEWTASTIDLLSANENITAIIASYGAPAIFTASGVKQSGRDVKVYGIDADFAMCQKIKDGEIAGLQPYDAKANAYGAFFSVLRLINGDKNVPDFTYAPQYLDMWLTKDNVEEYALKQFGKALQ